MTDVFLVRSISVPRGRGIHTTFPRSAREALPRSSCIITIIYYILQTYRLRFRCGCVQAHLLPRDNILISYTHTYMHTNTPRRRRHVQWISYSSDPREHIIPSYFNASLIIVITTTDIIAYLASVRAQSQRSNTKWPLYRICSMKRAVFATLPGRDLKTDGQKRTYA